MENIFTRSFFRESERARYSTSATLAASAGWKRMKPRSIQRRAPPATLPMPGTSTSTSATVTARRSGTASDSRRR